MLGLANGRLISPQLLCLYIDHLNDLKDDAFDILLLDKLLVHSYLHPKSS